MKKSISYKIALHFHILRSMFGNRKETHFSLCIVSFLYHDIVLLYCSILKHDTYFVHITRKSMGIGSNLQVINLNNAQKGK